MKYYDSILFLLIAPLLLSGTIKLHRNPDGVTESKWAGPINSVEAFAASPEISIADLRIVEGNAGQRPAQVMVSISQVMSRPVTLVYWTRNGTASAGSDYSAVNDSVTFAPGDILKRISIPVNGDVVVESDETFQIVLINRSDAMLADSIGTVTIINDDFKGGNSSTENVSAGSQSTGNFSTGNLSVYEVRFTHTGYTTFFGGPADCPIRSNGKVVLTGLLSGAENVASDDDIIYRGTLQLDIDIDICSATGEGDNAKQCGITVVGSGPVKTELEIQFDSRGGYIKINNSGGFMKSVKGSCDQAQMAEELTMVPNKTIASIFNGRDLPMLTDRTLRVGRYVETDGDNETVIEILRKITP